MPRTLTATLAIVALAIGLYAAEPLSLIDPAKPAGGWEFGNGPEFPGATGELKLADETFQGEPVLSIHGNFTKGGNYVHAFIPFPDQKIDTLSFWVNSPPGSSRIPVRVMDEETVHQINLRYDPKGGWQRIVLPVKALFKKMAAASSLDIVLKYESWKAASDAKWRKPRAGLSILASRAMGTLDGTVMVSDVLFHPDTEIRTEIAKTIRLDELFSEGESDWRYNDGREFKGGKGGLELLENTPEPGQYALRLHGDFTGGGAYVGAGKSLHNTAMKALKAVRLKLRSETAAKFSARFIDGTQQCHQRPMTFTNDGKWHDVELLPEKIAGGEHWGGANDGKWHDPLVFVDIIIGTASCPDKKVDLLIADVRADVTIDALLKGSAYTETFDDDDLPDTWQTKGRAELATPGHADSAHALSLKRTLEEITTETSAVSSPFPAGPGTWNVQCAWRADIYSTDNSYHGEVAIEALNAGGGPIDKTVVGIGCGKSDWQLIEKTVELPNATSSARLSIRLNKTYGTFVVDSLSVAPVSAAAWDKRVDKILISTGRIGNLFFPGDDVVVTVKTEGPKPLRPEQRTLQYSLRDYWGAEQIKPGTVELARTEGRKGTFTYATSLDLPEDELEVGKFYQLHVEVPEDGESCGESSGVAILPEAVSRQYEPDQIPFTIRNWDSRITEYFYLADRVGLRLFGVWGGWDQKPPYKPHLPGLDHIKKLGGRWVTGTPAASIEREGFGKWTEESLREGMKNFLGAYADKGLAMIATGNEPHGKGQKVLDNVRAYKAIYETAKAFNPDIHVIATSVEPNREYFEAGYFNYCDSYDFHIYEHYTNVRRTFAQYRALMEEFNAVKPVHCTELGLNSQGQKRRDVAIEMIKKLTVFFAEGGTTVSWFTIQYPDSKGKARGTFGDAHCVFDCKWNLYNPRLDAVTYYNMINSICVKRFVDERHYADGTQAYLFRDADSNCCQVVWLDEATKDVALLVPAGQDVRLVRFDGSDTTLNSPAGAVTLRASVEPHILLYRSPEGNLPDALGSPALSLTSPDDPSVALGNSTSFTLTGPGLQAGNLRVESPLQWKTSLRQTGPGKVECTVTAPAVSPADQARLYVQLRDGTHTIGEVTIPVSVTR